MSGMTSERLALIREAVRQDAPLVALLGGRGVYLAQLLAHVDHLTAENARLREGIAEALDLARLLPEQLECGGNSCHCTACDLVCELGNLLNPPTEGETDGTA